MSTPFEARPESPLDAPQPIPPAASRPTRPLYWSLRRELWENRALTIAPLAAAGVVLLGFMISTFNLPDSMRALAAMDPAQQAAVLARRSTTAALPIILTALIVGFFYCLDALHGERRDRSILFWKSLPVSDRVTVLAKASIPLLVLPLFLFALVVATNTLMLLAGTAVLMVNGLDAAPLWTQTPRFLLALELLYGLIVFALWYAPICGWLLLVSGWARRSTFLWAVLPPLALCLVEKIAFNTSYLGSMLKHRLAGVATEAFRSDGPAGGHADPIGFLASPGLWLGLIVFAVFLAAAVWLRRTREPI